MVNEISKVKIKMMALELDFLLCVQAQLNLARVSVAYFFFSFLS